MFAATVAAETALKVVFFSKDTKALVVKIEILSLNQRSEINF